MKVFITGVTGYIGGTGFAHLYKAHPDWEYDLLVRNEERAKPVKEKYPGAKLNFSYGGLDDFEVVSKAAAGADIVLHTADSSDNIPGVKAIAQGLKEGHTAEKPATYIHVSGTNILTWYDNDNGRHGEAPMPDQKYHDIDTIDAIVNFPDSADHRGIDKLVQECAASPQLRVAIVCPPCIYDNGSGPVSQRSRQVPLMTKVTLETGAAPVPGAGLTEWDNINVQDLGDIFVKLAEAGQDPSKRDNKEVFGPKAYYFTENGSHKWSEVAGWVAEEVKKQGYHQEVGRKVLADKAECNALGSEAITWSQNSKGVAARGEKYLGWVPKGRSLKDSIPQLVEQEAKLLGLKPKH